MSIRRKLAKKLFRWYVTLTSVSVLSGLGYLLEKAGGLWIFLIVAGSLFFIGFWTWLGCYLNELREMGDPEPDPRDETSGTYHGEGEAR